MRAFMREGCAARQYHPWHGPRHSRRHIPAMESDLRTVGTEEFAHDPARFQPVIRGNVSGPHVEIRWSRAATATTWTCCKSGWTAPTGDRRVSR
jgi:hypothetical protein